MALGHYNISDGRLSCRAVAVGGLGLAHVFIAPLSLPLSFIAQQALPSDKSTLNTVLRELDVDMNIEIYHLSYAACDYLFETEC